MCRSSVLFAALVLLLGAAALEASPAAAEGPSTASEQLAEDGYKLRVQNRDAEALEKFQAAYALRATPRYLAQIALAEQALGRWALAHEHLSAALQHTADPWMTRWNVNLKATLKKIESELATLEVACNVPGTVIAIAGREVGRTPLGQPLHVAAGTIAIDLHAEGYLPVSHVVNTVRGQLSRVDVTLIARTHPGAVATATPPAAVELPAATPAVAAAPPAPPVTAAPPASPVAAPDAASTVAAAPAPVTPPRTDGTAEATIVRPTAVSSARARDARWLYYGVSAGAAVALTGIVTYAVAGKKADRLEKDCYDKACEPDKRGDRRQNVRALDRASWALLPLGIAGMLASGAAYYWWPTPAAERRSALEVSASGDASHVMVHGTVEF